VLVKTNTAANSIVATVNLSANPSSVTVGQSTTVTATVTGSQGTLQLGQHRRRFLEKGFDQLLDEVDAGAGLELGEGRGVYDGCSHAGTPRAGTASSASTSRSTRIGFVR